MDLKMLLLKFGIIAMFYMQTVLLAKDTMEFSKYTFQWEDAEARCGRQGQILVPGRRYRAKLIKRWMEKENVQSVWLNGWRSVSDTTPDAGGKLRTLKVDFSRPQNKQLKMVCQIDSAFYDPLYVATSTEDAREICERDSAVLADIKNEEDMRSVTEAILADTPNWVNSISSQGSKIKQCLAAQRVGDDLKYVYEDCSKEYSFLCVKDNNLIASFSPLISLKMARYEEFEEEIEKQEQAMLSSLDLFESVSSTDIFLEVSSSDIMIQTTPTEVISATPTEVPFAVTPTVILSDTNTSKQPVEVTSTEEPVITSPELTTSEIAAVITESKTANESLSETKSEVTTSETPVNITKKAIEIEITTTDKLPEAKLSDTKSDITTSETPVDITKTAIESGITTTDKLPEVKLSDTKSKVTTSETLVDITKTAIESGITTTDKLPEVKLSDTKSKVTTSETLVDITKTAIESGTTDELPEETLSEKYTEVTMTKIPIEVKSSTVTSTVSEELSTLTPSEMFPVENTQDTGADIAGVPYYGTQESSPMIQSTGQAEYSPSTTQQAETSSILDAQYQDSIFASETEPQLQPVSTELPQSDSLYQLSPSAAMVLQDSSDVSMSKDVQSIHASALDDAIETDEHLMNTELLSLEPSSIILPLSTSPAIIGIESSVTDDYEIVDLDDLVMETSVQSSQLSETSVQKPEFTTETQPLIVATPVVSEQLMLNVSTSSSYTSEDTQIVTSLSLTQSSMYEDIPPFTSVSSKEDIMPEYTSSSETSELPSSQYYDIPDYILPDYSKSTSDTEVLIASESSTASFECTVIDSTSFCPDTTRATDKLDPTLLVYKTTPLTQMVKETSVSSPYSSSQSSSFAFDTDKDSDSSLYIPMPAPSTTVDVPSSSLYYYEYYYPLPDETNVVDDDEEFETDKVDEEIPGEIDEVEDEDNNEAGNDSVVGTATEEDEDGGIEVGLWVAFGILIALVLISLILALYLYRRRKLQKSKNISAANGAAAGGASAGETVELRDSRSPSRENGKPRESTTFKDPAYEI